MTDTTASLHLETLEDSTSPTRDWSLLATMPCSALIGCECSGIVRDALRAIGIDAWSCDLKPCEKGSAYHIQGDVMYAIESRDWSFIGLHPECTAMSLSGNRWYGRGMPRHQERLDAIGWTVNLWNKAIRAADLVYMENPTSVLWKYVYADIQYIQPWQFGHGEVKKTGLALHGLPYLTPTAIVEGREPKVWKMAPSPTRKADRSRTYPGIAGAIASQWGTLILQNVRPLATADNKTPDANGNS